MLFRPATGGAHKLATDLRGAALSIVGGMAGPGGGGTLSRAGLGWAPGVKPAPGVVAQCGSLTGLAWLATERGATRLERGPEGHFIIKVRRLVGCPGSAGS